MAVATKTKSKRAPKTRVAAKNKPGAVDRSRDLVREAQERFRRVTRDTTRKKAVQLALSVVEFQKATTANSIDLVGRVQDQTGRMLHDVLKNVSWVPSEGKQVVEEWRKTIEKGRADFKATSNKSYDLIIRYLERVQMEAEKEAAAAPGAAKKKTAAKGGPRKAAAKSSTKAKTSTKTKAKSGPRKAPSKRTTGTAGS